MSLDVWPPVPAHELKLKEAETLERELDWIVAETLHICEYLKHGLEDCYALLAPIDPGSTLVMSTPRNERVKGTVTRVGTRIVKGALNVQLRTLPFLSLNLSQSSAIHIHALDTLHTYLTQSLDLLSLTLSQETKPDPQSLSSNLTILSESLAESTALLKGPPTLATSDPEWQTESVPPEQFSPALGPNMSLHFSLQDSCIILWLRALEPVHAPVHFGTKLGLAIGTVRRLEHDEMDTVFRYNPAGWEGADSKHASARHSPDRGALAAKRNPPQLQDVYVREKVRVESADPSLISLYSKLGHLSNVLNQARANLTAVTGLEQET